MKTEPIPAGYVANAATTAPGVPSMPECSTRRAWDGTECAASAPCDARHPETCARACDEDGSAEACFVLGRMNQVGRGVPRDAVKAEALLERACAADVHRACMYVPVSGTEAEKTAARFALQSRACEHGVAPACTNLGRLYAAGAGAPKSAAKAAALYERGCNGESAMGCYMLERSLAAGEGVATDGPRREAMAARALGRLRTKCANLNGDACETLAIAHDERHLGPSNDAEIFTFTYRACALGLVGSCARLGAMYREGRGVAADPAAAETFEARACEDGHIEACAAKPAVDASK